MNVRLISITQPVLPEMEGATPEELIIYIARVSSPEQIRHETAPKLLRYLLEHKHLSPFDMVDMTVEVETSRAISAQMTRHWSFDFQEFSQRYAEVQGFEVYEARRQDPKSRQNSVDDLPAETRKWFREAQVHAQESAREAYREALARGIAKEQARFLLPMSAATKLYMKGSVRSWIFYLSTRTHWTTQREHRDVASAVRAVFAAKFPHTIEAMKGMEAAS